MKSTKKVSPIALEKGQLWKLSDTLIEIVGVGKSLAHYKRFHNPKQKGVPTKLERIQTVENYLKNEGAILVEREP